MSELYTAFDLRAITEARKNLLSAQLNTIEILRVIKSYKEMRKEELNRKRDMQKKLNKLKREVDGLIKLLPKIPREKKKKEKKETKKEKKLKIDKLDQELAEIKAKLEELNKRFS